MDLRKICDMFSYDVRLFVSYITYMKDIRKVPVEFALVSTEQIREYIKNPMKEYSFISWCKEMGIAPFREESIEQIASCKNCRYLMKEIHGDDYFCGDNYTNLDGLCENHSFDPSKSDEYLGKLFNR